MIGVWSVEAIFDKSFLNKNDSSACAPHHRKAHFGISVPSIWLITRGGIPSIQIFHLCV